MESVRLLTLLSCLLLCLTISCSDKSTDPNKPPPDNIPDNTVDAELLVDKLTVSVVPGGVEIVTVTATDENGLVEACTVESSNESVVTITQNDNVFMITGHDYGSAVVTVTSASNLTREIPVQIYNPAILDCGELIITYTNAYLWRWHDVGSGADNDGGYWHPVPPEGYHALVPLGCLIGVIQMARGL